MSSHCDDCVSNEETDHLYAEIDRLSARVAELEQERDEARAEADRGRGRLRAAIEAFLEDHEHRPSCDNGLCGGPDECWICYVAALSAPPAGTQEPSGAEHVERHAVNGAGDCAPWCRGCRWRIDRGLPLDWEPAPQEPKP